VGDGPLRAPFMGLSAQRFRPAVDGGLEELPELSGPPFTGVLAVWLQLCFWWLKPNTEKPRERGSEEETRCPRYPPSTAGPNPFAERAAHRPSIIPTTG